MSLVDSVLNVSGSTVFCNQPSESTFDLIYSRACVAASIWDVSFVRMAMRNVTAARSAVEEESLNVDGSFKVLCRDPSDS